ncbi:hypothetical protein SLEP1_g38252 [Rubroshorea leprosula]|uniref:Uncharacterized protein n=1 Tax=Rubroshorea leprosula TaxID=152421 RepID=A0AAV5KXU8_9ROSI|nr:hypothetical protein SLEP1_g38252 [Rubroshorea leprosula]
MVKGRAPCCDKNEVKKGPWSAVEDLMLTSFIQKHGHQNWRALPRQAGLLRCGKSCRLRWINYLRPDVKRGNFTREEEDTIIRLHEILGNKWSKIASHLPGRTDNEIKNMWNTHLKKRLAARKIATAKAEEYKESSWAASSSSSSSTLVSSSTGLINPALAGLEEEQPWDEGSSVAKIPQWPGTQGVNTEEQTRPVEETNEISSSSISSIFNNFSQAYVSNPEEDDEIGLLLGVAEALDARGIFDEVNQPNIADPPSDIPRQSDFDFWNTLYLDNIGPFQSTNGVQSQEAEAETKKWLRYLENELGLESTVEENQGHLTNAAVEPSNP